MHTVLQNKTKKKKKEEEGMHTVDTYVVSWQELYNLGQFSHKMKAIKNLRTAGR